MTKDPRPATCRFRLRDEYSAYPKSSCTACGRSVLTDLGDSCPYGPNLRQEPEHPAELIVRRRSLSERAVHLADKLAEQLAPSQAVVDGVEVSLRLLAQDIAELEAGVLQSEEDAQAAQPPPIEDQIGIGWTAVLVGRRGAGMTVNNFIVVGGEVRTVICVWHDEQNCPHSAEYSFKALELHPPKV